jgi:alkanesulfonate monooxygenase SsuD/methylene tetrahydromethanopterin reductase-like flavin-dependent oxidoreductase (luciferase family)
MDVAIGMPNAVAGTKGEELLRFAQAADEAGFSSLGTLDRVVYDSYDPLVALGAAAAVTERIRLATAVLLAPLRMNAVSIAKQALSLDALAGGGRVVLGIGLGGREDDYEVSGIPTATRGDWMDSAVARIRQVFDGEGELEAEVGPRAGDKPPGLLVGGQVDASFARAARHADGWIMGGGTPDQFAEGHEKLRAAWEREGRDGKPRTAALAYYGLGPKGEEEAQRDLRHYYAWLGDEIAGAIAGSAATDPDTVTSYLKAFEDAGCDELIFFATSSDPKQVDLLAEAAGL